MVSLPCSEGEVVPAAVGVSYSSAGRRSGAIGENAAHLIFKQVAIFGAQSDRRTCAERSADGSGGLAGIFRLIVTGLIRALRR
jgi:hypothetical protein